MLSRPMMLAATAAATAALALGAVLTTVQATRTVTISSHITIKGRGLTFSGGVSSTKAACIRARKVTLYRTASLALGTTRTNSSGHWRITVSGSAGVTLGHFYARVKKRSEGTAGTIYVCKAASSKTVAYTP